MTAYGGGGHHDQEGVQHAFGGYAFFRDEETGACFLGVWGARNASRFRTALRRKAEITIIREPLLARLTWWTAEDDRPPKSVQSGTD